MRVRHILPLAALLAVPLLALSALDAGGLKRSDAHVKVSADASKPNGGKQTIKVTLNIDDGWYVYANPVENEDFDANKTTVKVLADGKEVDAKIDYPRGKLKKTGDFNYAIYQGKATINVEVPRPAAAKSLELAVRFSTCSVEGKCLLPATVKVNVP